MNTKYAFAAAFAVAAAFALSSCRKSDVKDLTLEIPALEPGSRCAGDVSNVLARLVGVVNCDKSFGIDGIKHFRPEFDYAKKTVSLSYESLQTNTKNIEIAIARDGWTANGITPESVGAKSKMDESVGAKSKMESAPQGRPPSPAAPKAPTAAPAP